MKKALLLLSLLPLIVSCSRVPSGVFGVADGSEAAPRVVDANSNTRAERDLKRLQQIDQNIQASLARLDAALDPNNTDPAHLEKLIVGDEMDPALANSRSLRQQAAIEKKFDEKNQALLDNSRTGNLDELQKTSDLDPKILTREQRSQIQIDQKIDEKVEKTLAGPAESEPETQAEEPAPEVEAPESDSQSDSSSSL